MAFPPDLADPDTAAEYRLYWSDRLRLDALPPSTPFTRDLVPGEFRDLTQERLDGVTQVRVWRGGEKRGSGSVRHRRPLAEDLPSFSDAEDAVNPFFHLGPP
jgi:hypothetical protein